MLKKRRISLKIAAVTGIVEIIAMTALFFTTNHFLTKILEQKSIADMQIIAKDRAELVETYIKGCCDFLDSYSKNPEVISVLKNRNDKNFINKMRKATIEYTKLNPSLEGLYIADWNTFVLTHNNPSSCDKTFRNKKSAEYLERTIKEKGRAFCSGIVLAPVTKQMVIPIYAPIYDENGEAIGFAGAAFHTTELAEKLESLATGSTKYSLIDASNNVYIFDEDFSLVGTTCDKKNILNTISKLIKSSVGNNSLSYITDEFVVNSYFMADRYWVFFIAETKENAFIVIKYARRIIAGICILITLLMIFICALSVNHTMKPIQTINDELERLKKSNYDNDPNIEKLGLKNDEFGTIATSLSELHSVLEDQFELFHEIFEAQTVGTLVTNSEDTEILLINKMALRLYGIPLEKRDSIKMEDIKSLFDAEETEKIREVRELSRLTKDEIVYETSLTHEDGKKIHLLSHAKSTKLLNGETVIIFSFVDITTRKKLEENLLILSETDSLTSICNRRSGEYKVKKAIIEGKHGMFCLFDANKFKYVNDNFGHSAGDQVLIEIANNMKKTFRGTDILIRLGGDEFVVFAPNIETKEVGTLVLERFMHNISKIDIPALKGHKISISLGAVLVTDSEEFSHLYKKADSLMYDCKKQGGNAYKFYDDPPSV